MRNTEVVTGRVRFSFLNVFTPKASVNNAEPKYDIRDWSPDGTKTSKGITLNNEEVQLLFDLLKDELS